MILRNAPLLLLTLHITTAQPPIPPPERPDCTAGWQSPDLTYVPTIAACATYEEGNGVPCSPNAPQTCTGRNPFCASDQAGGDEKSFRCCSDIIQDSTEMATLTPEEIKPACPNGAIAYRMPYVMLCDPAIVNICPYVGKGFVECMWDESSDRRYDYTCVEAANGHLLPPDGRSLCCKTSTLYSFASVFVEARISPRIVPQPPLAAIEYVTLNVHTSATMHAPEIRTGDHFVLAPYRLLEPAYIKQVKLYHEQPEGSHLHVILFDPNSATENLQFYYDRPSKGGKLIDLEEPIPDGGFIYKKVYNAPPITTEQQQQTNKSAYRKLWVAMVFKTVKPVTRLYVSVTMDLHSKYRSVTEFLTSATGRMLGTPVAGTYFYLTAD